MDSPRAATAMRVFGLTDSNQSGITKMTIRTVCELSRPPGFRRAGFFISSSGDHDMLARPAQYAPMPSTIDFGIPAMPAAADDDKLDIKNAVGVPAAAREIARDFDEAARKIDEDDDLSEQGRAKARARLAAEHAKKLDRTEAVINDALKAFEAQAATIQQTLDSAGKGDAAAVMLATEYRSVLRAMTHEARTAETLDAINSKDVTKLRAIAGAMAAASGLHETDAGLYGMARRALLMAEHGTDVIDRLNRYRATIEAAQRGVETARTFLRERAGVEG